MCMNSNDDLQINSTFEDLGISIPDLFTFMTQFEEIPFAKGMNYIHS